MKRLLKSNIIYFMCIVALFLIVTCNVPVEGAEHGVIHDMSKGYVDLDKTWNNDGNMCWAYALASAFGYITGEGYEGAQFVFNYLNSYYPNRPLIPVSAFMLIAQIMHDSTPDAIPVNQIFLQQFDMTNFSNYGVDPGDWVKSSMIMNRLPMLHILIKKDMAHIVVVYKIKVFDNGTVRYWVADSDDGVRQLVKIIAVGTHITASDASQFVNTTIQGAYSVQIFKRK